ncbi:atypical/PIKK/PI3K protein kinase [Gymnopus androsaceus JB14]|uniref:Phosphatidylinositol 3-kinase VPS34 n=1 Tax=Gymnopus androsaceus JB14 TaxID=1447944 RepID=A0A6A4GKR6_9AGAR|nr:atypical/PIKK/PI3K protein kinase [Gymnopus androsaceus JB14]
MDKDHRDDFTFARLSDLKLPVVYRTFREPRPAISRRSVFVSIFKNASSIVRNNQGSRTLSDLYVICQLIADNKPLTIPFRTSFKAFKNAYIWNEWITFPIRYCDLPLSAQITFTVWDIAGPRAAAPVGGTTFRLFGKKWTLRRGKHRLLLWLGTEADGSVESTTPSKIPGSTDEMGRLEKLVKKYERGDLAKSEWLDKLTFRKMEEIHAAETQKSENLYLYIDLPRFDFPVIFSEPESLTNPASTSALPPPTLPPAPQTPIQSSANSFASDNTHLWSIIDPEVTRENPVEDKHRRLVRSHRSGPYDRELKPNAKDRDNIGEILNYAPSQPLSPEEKDLIWKFRFHLARDKRGLTKFLKAVTWRDPSEVKQAVEELLPQWTEIDTDDALELLGPGTVDSRVRAFAVRQLMRADDDELLLYLLQLVQALKFESAATDQRSSRSATNAISYDDSGLTDFLISRGVQNSILGNRLYWYLMVEVALEDKVISKMYGRVVFKFMNKILEVENGSDRRELLRRQGQLVEMLAKRARELRISKDSSIKKKEQQSLLHASSPLPLNAQIEITGIIPEKSSVFKSAMYPLLLTFQCSDGTEYPVIFKDGDDMRQDQLVLQMFTLMDRLLRQENLDLKLTPYAVLSYGSDARHGAVCPEQDDCSDCERVWEWSVGTWGIEPGVIDTFVRSCAGYCVVTYLLGVGDRHLDNLLVAPDGHFFHVDFGYILGRDPKPFPPAVKVCKEMVDGMGGTQSAQYMRFKSFCFTAFTILRKSANLILNLVTLMVDASIPDIKHRDVHEQIQEKFRLDLTEEEAIKHFEMLLNETSYFTVMLDRIHDLTQQYWRT